MSVDVRDEVDLSAQALREFGVDVDEQLERSLVEQYCHLRSHHEDGELFVQVPLSANGISVDGLLRVIDTLKPRGAESPSINRNAWVPGASRDAYTYEQLNSLGAPHSGLPYPHARMLMPVFPDEDPGFGDPQLHAIGAPFDRSRIPMHARGERSLAERLSAKVVDYDLLQPNYSAGGLNLAGACMIVLQRYIRGVKTPFGLEQHLEFPQMPRMGFTASAYPQAIPALRTSASGRVEIEQAYDGPHGSNENGGMALTVAPSAAFIARL